MKENIIDALVMTAILGLCYIVIYNI